MNFTAVLYMTDQCSLCEEALEALMASKALRGWSIRAIDIMQSEDLTAVLGERIPVLELDGVQLDWPFNEADLLQIAKPK